MVKGRKDYNGYVWEDQVSQDQANYDPLGATDGKACANCQWFNSPDGCLLVQGDISPTGLSGLWLAKANSEPYVQPVEVTNWPTGMKSNKSVPEMVKNWFVNLFSEPDKPEMEGLRPVYVTKDVNGGLRATIVFSNNFKDRHDQTIPEVVQEDYIEFANRTKLYPEYQIWHLGGKSRWGQADSVIKSGNFIIASGPVDPGKEELAEAFANDPNTGVSNGYYAMYSPDKKDFTSWYPFEVSTLPVIASANVWMGAENTLIEEGYLMKDEYKALLAAKGLPPELITAIEQDTNARGATVTGQGVGSKEVGDGLDMDALAASIGKAIQGQITPVIERLDALEAGQKALETKTSVNADEAMANAIAAKIGQLPQGFKASTDPTTVITDPTGADGSLDPRFNYLDNALDTVLAQNGVGK